MRSPLARGTFCSMLVCAVVTVGTLQPTVVQAQDEATRRGRATVPAEVRAVTDFLLLAYPDLAQRAVTITVNPSGGGKLAVSVTDAVTPPGSGPIVVAEPLLTAAFEFAASGELRSFAAQGAFLEETRNGALTDELLAHPAWTDSDVEIAVRAIGGRVVTGTTASAFPAGELWRWSNFVGTNPRVGETTSRGLKRTEAGASAPPAVAPGWTTLLEATAKDGQAASYQLLYEPFGGRLIAVMRR